MLYMCCIHLLEPVQFSCSVSFLPSSTRFPRVRADGLPRASSDELCTATMAGQEAVHRLNARIAETLLLSEANEIPLPQNCRRVRGRIFHTTAPERRLVPALR